MIFFPCTEQNFPCLCISVLHKLPMLSYVSSTTQRCEMLFYFGTARGRTVSTRRHVHSTKGFHYRISPFILQSYVVLHGICMKVIHISILKYLSVLTY